MAFNPSGVILGAGVGPLTPAQAEGYAPTLNDLRVAAHARRKVTLYWDDATRVVSTFVVRWDQAC